MCVPWITIRDDFKILYSKEGFSELQVSMASDSIMKGPICLVKNEKEQLAVNSKAIRILDKISQPVVVVAIVGLYRTGKSYLMNRLAGQNHGKCDHQTEVIWHLEQTGYTS